MVSVTAAVVMVCVIVCVIVGVGAVEVTVLVGAVTVVVRGPESLMSLNGLTTFPRRSSDMSRSGSRADFLLS